VGAGTQECGGVVERSHIMEGGGGGGVGGQRRGCQAVGGECDGVVRAKNRKGRQQSGGTERKRGSGGGEQGEGAGTARHESQFLQLSREQGRKRRGGSYYSGGFGVVWLVVYAEKTREQGGGRKKKSAGNRLKGALVQGGSKNNWRNIDRQEQRKPEANPWNGEGKEKSICSGRPLNPHTAPTQRKTVRKQGKNREECQTPKEARLESGAA